MTKSKNFRKFLTVWVSVWLLLSIVLLISSAVVSASLSGLRTAMFYTESVYGADGNKGDIVGSRVDNPHPFNENCVFYSNMNYKYFDDTEFTSYALKFYELSGCQAYAVAINAENQGITTNEQLKNYVSDVLNSLIDDEYAFIIYKVDSFKTDELDKYGNIVYLHDSGIVYGDKTHTVLNADARRIIDIIFNNPWRYSHCWNSYSNEEVVLSEATFQLYPSSFTRRPVSVSLQESYNLYSSELLLDLEEAKEIEKATLIKRNILLLLSAFCVVFPLVFAGVMFNRRAKAKETVEILAVDLNKLNEAELSDLAKKYE